MPEHLLGEQWRFASLKAGDVDEFRNRRIPILKTPDFLLPLNLGLASTLPIPGIVIYGGRQSMRLARWLQESEPVALNYRGKFRIRLEVQGRAAHALCGAD